LVEIFLVGSFATGIVFSVWSRLLDRDTLEADIRRFHRRVENAMKSLALGRAKHHDLAAYRCRALSDSPAPHGCEENARTSHDRGGRTNARCHAPRVVRVDVYRRRGLRLILALRIYWETGVIAASRHGRSTHVGAAEVIGMNVMCACGASCHSTGQLLVNGGNKGVAIEHILRSRRVCCAAARG